MGKYRLFMFLPFLSILALTAGASEARAGNFKPIPAGECQDLQGIAGKALGTAFTMNSDAPFVDLRTDEEGQGCTLTATGTGIDFPKLPGELAKKLTHAFHGWKMVTDASVYAGFGADGGYVAMTRDSSLMVIFAGWDLTPEGEAEAEAKCPDVPVSECETVKPEQKLYTIEIHAARK
jgi:hypothetical protein